MNYDLLKKIIKRTSIEHIKAKEEHDLDRRQWERTKVIKGKEWLTEWGAGLLLAEGLGMTGYEARDAADNRQIQYESNGRLNYEIRDAINGGELSAISEFLLSAIRPNELGYKSVLIKKTDFIAWLSVSYPAFDWVESEEEFKPLQQNEEVGESAAKYDKWQEAVNNEYAKNKRLSHSAVCARLASGLGTSAENLRRRTTHPKKLKL